MNLVIGTDGEIERLHKQQNALVNFGTFALRETDLQTILTEAARICADGLNTPFAKICRYRHEENDLIIVALAGWSEAVAGRVVSAGDDATTQGRAFATGAPVVLDDVAKNDTFTLPDFYADHKIVSTVDVLIRSREGSWGVLEVDSARKRHFDKHDIVFLTGFANIAAEAVLAADRAQEKLESEIQLQELQLELQHLARVNAIGQRAAVIVHELNQPLAAIANYVGTAKLTLERARVFRRA